MLGLLDLVTKRVNDQMIEYAAAQSDIARRLWGNWLDPFHACQPAKIRGDRHRRPEIDPRTGRRRQL
ncbi:hypothetical protein [Bosea sp. ANAM02]|uniref:hypothetical protein n=1 Tax=Bosea sp. ANAM02 TaxID=2020412 RepID=UPI000646B67D|nr:MULTISPECIES: hypothetical protein [Hyphomicrobiales]BCB17658.1 hypothetical protein OCUBac02_05520 [Bosea sp. ANAM02]